MLLHSRYNRGLLSWVFIRIGSRKDDCQCGWSSILWQREIFIVLLLNREYMWIGFWFSGWIYLQIRASVAFLEEQWLRNLSPPNAWFRRWCFYYDPRSVYRQRKKKSDQKMKKEKNRTFLQYEFQFMRRIFVIIFNCDVLVLKNNRFVNFFYHDRY